MLEALNSWLGHWEPLWLFLALYVYDLINVYYSKKSHEILVKEFEYDKEWNERRSAKRKRHLQFEKLCEGEGK